MDNIVIAQQFLQAFINALSPRAYSPITKVKFKTCGRVMETPPLPPLLFVFIRLFTPPMTDMLHTYVRIQCYECELLYCHSKLYKKMSCTT